MMNKFKVKSKKLKNMMGFATTTKIFGSLQNKQGFTILESLFAIFILSLTIAGVFTAVQQSLSQSIIAKDEVKAFHLAQEAIEIIRNKRDSNHLVRHNIDQNHYWLSQITTGAGCPLNTYCTVDATTMTINQTGCLGNEFGWHCVPPLRQNHDYLIGHNPGWRETNFKRVIMIEEISPTEIVVTVRMMWTKGILTREFTTKTILLNWI